MSIRLKQKAATYSPQKSSRPAPRWWLWLKVAIFLILGLVAGTFAYPAPWNSVAHFISEKTPLNLPEWNPRSFRLGLDLLGGSELAYEADLSGIGVKDQNDAMNGVRDVIERRVNSMGVSEPLVQIVRTHDSYRVNVQLAGISDVNEAIKQIGETPVLEFKEEASQNPGTQSATNSLLTEAQTKVDAMKNKLAANPFYDYGRLARESGLTFEDIGFVTKASNYDIWQWADTNGVGKQTKDPVETPVGWNFVRVMGERPGDKEVEASHILICYKGATRCDRDTSKEDVLKQIQDLKTKVNGGNFAELAKQYSTEQGVATTGGYLDWFSRGQMVKPFEDAVYALGVGEISDVVETEFGYHLIYKTAERNLKEYSIKRILVAKPAVANANGNWVNTGLSGKHLTSARVNFDPNSGEPLVSLVFNDEGKELFGQITKRNVGKRVAIFLDGNIISAPTVQQEIVGGDAIITNIGSVPDAKLLAQRLNAGALPVPIKLISQQTVGATLGQNSLQKSMVAGLIGFALVALFMILYYRVPGFVSVIALVIYTAIVLMLFKLIPVTLTLAGIAGFVLSLGIAVDANVLIFERMKEELLAGHSLGSAIDEGAHRAWFSIRDSHFTTVLSALVLFWFSSSMIKGFALTLAIGVLLSLFSALTVSQTFLRLVAGWKWKKWLGLFKPYTKNKIINNQ